MTRAAAVSVLIALSLTPTFSAPRPSRVASTVSPADGWTRAELENFRGDLMIWAPEVGCAPEARIRCDARGLQAGWVWTVSLPRYSPARRAQLYDRIQAKRYTHVAVRVTVCEPGGGYHDLYPNTRATCAEEIANTNLVLRELADRRLIPVCAGVGPDDPVDPGIDVSRCPIALDDWDNSARAWERLTVLQRTFPKGTLLYFELPLGNDFPEASGGDEPVAPRADNGREWLREVRRRIPNFVGVLHELDKPGAPANDGHIRRAHAWWADVQEVNFESDTYWKFWDRLTEDGQGRYNDSLMRTYPWLRGCMSGCTAAAWNSVSRAARRRFARRNYDFVSPVTASPIVVAAP